MMQWPRKNFRYKNIFILRSQNVIRYQIMDISETSAPAEGGKKIIILCERVARDDIKVEKSLVEKAYL